MKNFDFKMQPGQNLNVLEFEKDYTPTISVIMPYYNSKDTIEQSVNSVLNQTYPCFELVIINDGSPDEESVEKLKEIEKLDKRIRVLHKENGGAAEARNYGVEHSDKRTKYLSFIDSDDMVDNTFLETLYFALETNPKSSWAYTDSVGFQNVEYTWNKAFDSELMKRENNLIITSLVKKEDFNLVGGFYTEQKHVYEDWHLWLKLLAENKSPIHLSYYGAWYRRAENTELSRGKQNHEASVKLLSGVSDKITKIIEPIEFPRFDFNWEQLVEKFDNIEYVKRKANNKINILMIIPWMVVGGADRFNIDLLKGLPKDKYEFTILTTEPAINTYRQLFEQENVYIYDLTSFLDNKYWIGFVNYIIKKNNINLVFNTNSEVGYSILPYIKAKNNNIPIVDYVHMEEWYTRNGGYSRDSSGVASVIDKTMTCNGNSTRILEEYFGRNKKELETVYIGVNEKLYDPTKFNKEEIREEYGIKTKYAIGFICRITEQKRPLLLVEAIKKLSAIRDDFTVIVAGDGNLLAEMKKKTSKFGLTNKIKYIGNISTPNKFYSAVDLTVNCSIKEGLALTSYESLAMGIPVVSSDVGGQKELINEDVGIIIPLMQREEDILITEYKKEEVEAYAKAIDKVLNNIDKYKSKCQKRILDGFTIKKMVEKMDKIFTKTYKNPNKEKQENGIGLSKNIEICKDLITKTIMGSAGTYTWQVQRYQENYGYLGRTYKFDLFKEKMWRNKGYRTFIKSLQAMGIMKIIKKVLKRR